MRPRRRRAPTTETGECGTVGASGHPVIHSVREAGEGTLSGAHHRTGSRRGVGRVRRDPYNINSDGLYRDLGGGGLRCVRHDLADPTRSRRPRRRRGGRGRAHAHPSLRPEGPTVRRRILRRRCHRSPCWSSPCLALWQLIVSVRHIDPQLLPGPGPDHPLHLERPGRHLAGHRGDHRGGGPRHAARHRGRHRRGRGHRLVPARAGQPLPDHRGLADRPHHRPGTPGARVVGLRPGPQDRAGGPVQLLPHLRRAWCRGWLGRPRRHEPPAHHAGQPVPAAHAGAAPERAPPVLHRAEDLGHLRLQCRHRGGVRRGPTGPRAST